jgi:hypothetical protein
MKDDLRVPGELLEFYGLIGAERPKLRGHIRRPEDGADHGLRQGGKMNALPRHQRARPGSEERRPVVHR